MPRGHRHPTLVKYATPATRCSPVVAQLYVALREQRMTYTELARRSGVSKYAIESWRYVRRPSVDNLEACLNVLGYTLAISPLEKKQSVS